MEPGMIVALVVIMGLLIFGNHQESRKNDYKTAYKKLDRAYKSLLSGAITLGAKLGEPEKSDKKREVTSEETARIIMHSLYQGGVLTNHHAPENPRLQWQEMAPDQYFIDRYLGEIVPDYHNKDARDMDLWGFGSNISDSQILDLARHLAHNYKKDTKK